MGFSYRGTYSDVEMCYCRGYYVDLNIVLFYNYYNVRGYYFDNENFYYRGYFCFDSEYYY